MAAVVARPTTDTWLPTKNLPFSGLGSTDNALFGTAYKVTLTVVAPETGAVVATASRAVTTAPARVPTCASASNLGGTAGHYPGRTTDGALWLSYTVKNCGGRDWLDTDFQVVDTATGA